MISPLMWVKRFCSLSYTRWSLRNESFPECLGISLLFEGFGATLSPRMHSSPGGLYNYLEPKWPLFLKVNPPKQGLFQPKQGSFGSQVYIPFLGSGIPTSQPTPLWRWHASWIPQVGPTETLDHHSHGNVLSCPQEMAGLKKTKGHWMPPIWGILIKLDANRIFFFGISLNSALFEFYVIERPLSFFGFFLFFRDTINGQPLTERSHIEERVGPRIDSGETPRWWPWALRWCYKRQPRDAPCTREVGAGGEGGVGSSTFGESLDPPNSLWVSTQKNRGETPKMDGENNGKPYEQMDDFGGPPLFLETPL